LSQVKWFTNSFLITDKAFKTEAIVISKNTLLICSELIWPLQIHFDVLVCAFSFAIALQQSTFGHWADACSLVTEEEFSICNSYKLWFGMPF